jgi:hypothetical protein
MNFSIERINSKKYACAVFATSYINPLHDARSIEKGLNKQQVQPGKVLFDLLLSNGENFNRFFEVYFDGSQLDMSNAQIVEPDECTRKAVNAFYKGKARLISSGVLSPSQRFQFARGK